MSAVGKRPPLPEEPLPCPFCGGVPKMNIMRSGMSIKCDNPDCLHPGTGLFYDAERCVALWNRRCAP